MPHAPIVEVDWPKTGTWTDVTRYVRDEAGIRITRGRGDEQTEIQPGTMALTFHNDDGRFTPGLATGAYYPNVRKARPIRCRLIAWTTNMLTNSSFEAGTSDWSAAGTVPPALAQSNTHVQAGSQALRITWGTGGTGPAAQITVYGLEIGLVYTASAYVYVPSGGAPAVRLGVSGIATGTASSTTNAFQRITYTFTATDTYAVLQVTPSSSPTSGQQVWVDAVQVERGASATTYSSSDAVISTRFVGRVNEWPLEWHEGITLALTTITATDIMKRLGGLAQMRSLLEEEFLYLAPDAYYTLAEPSGSTSGGDTSGRGQSSMKTYQVAGAGGAVDFGADEGPGPDGLSAPAFAPFSATQGKGVRANLTPATGSVVIACWLKADVAGRDFLQACNRFSGLGGAATVLNADLSDGSLRVTAFAGELLVSGDFGPYVAGNLGDGASHFVAVLLKDDGGVFVNVDGVGGSSGLAFGTAVLPVNAYDRLVAGGFKEPITGAANLWDGSLSHIWYARRATMPSWTDVWTAGSGMTEATTARFTRLCRLIGVTGTTKGSSTTQIDPQAAGGKKPIDALRDVAGVEAGLVYGSRSADAVVFETRAWRYNKASAVTLDATAIWDDLTWSDDDQPLLNDCTNQRIDGADQRVTDADSIAEYGTCDGGSSQPWASDDDALAAAQWAVYKGADPPPRITAVTLAASTLASYTTILGLDVSDVIALTSLPAPSPSAALDLHVEGYEETISLILHTITFNTSPAEVNQVWQLGVAGFSELGDTTRLAL